MIGLLIYPHAYLFEMETVGDYEYELHEGACLGHGAFGAVYKGRQRNVRR